MDNQTLLIIVAIIVVAILLYFLYKGLKGSN